MRLDAYLDRIGFSSNASRPNFETLRAVHRAHQYTVPFENLDVQLGRPLSIDIDAAYDKIVNRRRGGWCYELNGLMGWALRELGFDVTRLCAGVMREKLGDEQLGNHLCLLVNLDQPYLVDVGFGGSLSEPLPLSREERHDAPYRIWLNELDTRTWRFSEATHGDEPFSFDFRLGAADESLFAAKCRFLQTDATSPFVLNLVVQRRTPVSHVSLRGRILTVTHSTHVETTQIDSPDELETTLQERFDLHVPEARGLWTQICARHDALFVGST